MPFSTVSFVLLISINLRGCSGLTGNNSGTVAGFGIIYYCVFLIFVSFQIERGDPLTPIKNHLIQLRELLLRRLHKTNMK